MKALQAAGKHCLQMLNATSGQYLSNILLAMLALGALFGNANCCNALCKPVKACVGAPVCQRFSVMVCLGCSAVPHIGCTFLLEDIWRLWLGCL